MLAAATHPAFPAHLLSLDAPTPPSTWTIQRPRVASSAQAAGFLHLGLGATGSGAVGTQQVARGRPQSRGQRRPGANRRESVS